MSELAIMDLTWIKNCILLMFVALTVLMDGRVWRGREREDGVLSKDGMEWRDGEQTVTGRWEGGVMWEQREGKGVGEERRMSNEKECKWKEKRGGKKRINDR